MKFTYSHLIGDFQCRQSMQHVRFEVFTAVTMKKAVFWDVAPCRCGVIRRFGGTYRLLLLGRRETSKLLVPVLTVSSRANFILFFLLP